MAQLLAARAERRVVIQYTGLRVGEKLHEVLLGPGELDRRPAHPLISHVGVEPLEPLAVRSMSVDGPCRVIAGNLAALCVQPAEVAPADD